MPSPNLPPDRSRRTVVVADDHPRMLDAVCRRLADDFQVIAAVTDGRQAVEAVTRLRPDAVVLDITMPTLDGFQAARALRQSGAGVTIVVLSLHAADEFVHAAFVSGAHGYVLKSRMDADLTSAVHHTLAARAFVPYLTTLSTIAGDTGGHALHVRADDGAFLDEVATFLHRAIRRGDRAAVVGTPATRAGLAQRLRAFGCDVDHATAEGRYAASDAADAVSQVIAHGRLDPARVAAIVDSLEWSRLAGAHGRPRRLTVFGEMNVLLLKDGNRQAAIDLEHMWSELTRRLPFLTVCSYPQQFLDSGRYPEVWPAVCAAHTAICHSTHLR